jgi:hypothetical protein
MCFFLITAADASGFTPYAIANPIIPLYPACFAIIADDIIVCNT